MRVFGCLFNPIALKQHLLMFFILTAVLMPQSSEAYTRSDLKKFQGSIIDYRHRLNSKFKKNRRSHTNLVIVHTSELGLDATLRVVSKGKQFKSGYKTPGGHAHYVIARNGRTYRILDRKYRADHAGLSMWNKKSDVSRTSIGIELVGYSHAPITQSQYRSLGRLLHILKQVYGLRDRDILTHSQVAYGKPNPWFRKDHRGRKRCAKNFIRSKAGLGATWTHDPDVQTGRLMADPILAKVFYPVGGQLGGQRIIPPPSKTHGGTEGSGGSGSNIISRQNSAWSIAGGEYNEATTAYILPDGRALSGNMVGSKIGWSRLPAGTKVLLNQETEQVKVQARSPIKTISDQMTAWSHAGLDYRADTTIYFFASGRISPGSAIQDWDDLPRGTRLIVGYKGPFEITRTRTAYKIAGQKYKNGNVLYHLPSGSLTPGDKMTGFASLPKGVRIYLPLTPGG